MKKKVFAIALLLVLILSLSVSAFAEDGGLDYVTDAAGLLTYEQWEHLENLAETASENAQCGIYIVTVDDFMNYYDTDSVEVCAQSIYHDYELGYGEGKDGILLLLSMADRDFDLCAYGDFGNYAYTDYGKDMLDDEFLDDFSRNDWAAGFEDYIGTAYSFAMSAQNGEPIDSYGGRGSTEGNTTGKIAAVVLIPALAALIVCSIMKGKMKSVAEKKDAAEYLQAESVQLTRQMDQFTHVTETRTHIDRGSSRSGGGGTSVNSSGFSHHSGKF